MSPRSSASQTQAPRGGVIRGNEQAGPGGLAACFLSHDSPEEEKRPRAPRSVPRAALGSCCGSTTSRCHPLALPGHRLSAWATLPHPQLLFPCAPRRGLGLRGPHAARVPEAGGRVGLPRGVLESRRGSRSRGGGRGGRTWRRCPRADVRPRRAPVPARSAAERGTKRPAHSCALTHRRHVARRRRRRFAQNWSGARAGRAQRGGWERGAGSERRWAPPTAEDFPKQAREGATAGMSAGPRQGQAGGHRVRVGG